MAKVLRTHNVGAHNVTPYVAEEIALLTRGAACAECVEILIEKSLYGRLLFESPPNGKILGYKFRVVHGPGVRHGSLAVITRTEVVFK